MLFSVSSLSRFGSAQAMAIAASVSHPCSSSRCLVPDLVFTDYMDLTPSFRTRHSGREGVIQNDIFAESIWSVVPFKIFSHCEKPLSPSRRVAAHLHMFRRPLLSRPVSPSLWRTIKKYNGSRHMLERRCALCSDLKLKLEKRTKNTKFFV